MLLTEYTAASQQLKTLVITITVRTTCVYIHDCTYTLQAPTGHYTLQQITATPILLTFDGKLITATMNPMDSQQQSTATKNF